MTTIGGPGSNQSPLLAQQQYDARQNARGATPSQKTAAPKQPKQPGYFLNKVVVITGASSGIGRTLAYWYLNAGSKVALVGRDIAELDAIGKNFPSQALVVQADLTIDMQMLDMKTAVAEKFGGVDILINCAGKSPISNEADLFQIQV